jgi:hypothetical protein
MAAEVFVSWRHPSKGAYPVPDRPASLPGGILRECYDSVEIPNSEEERP